jgi:hypothetical protein
MTNSTTRSYAGVEPKVSPSRYVRPWAKRVRKPPTQRDLQERDRRRSLKARVDGILRDVERLRRKHAMPAPEKTIVVRAVTVAAPARLSAHQRVVARWRAAKKEAARHDPEVAKEIERLERETAERC